MQDSAITPPAEQAIQHAAIGSPPTTVWWAQPAATLISATAVIIVAVFTFRHNRRKLRNEQLEKRAKDREIRLLELHGDFASAGLQVIKVLADLQRGRDDAEETENILGPPDERPSMLDAVIGHQNMREEERKAVTESRTKLNEAYARLMLMEDDAYRLGHVSGTFEMLNELTPRRAADEQERLTQFMRDGCADLGLRLHKDYLEHRRLAEKGQVPIRVIPTKLMGSVKPSQQPEKST